jgi:peptidyl-tRNA hydrolase, PTH2 family
MSEHEAKQVIVMRKDLKMRRGKEIAQGSHASLGAVLACISDDEDGWVTFAVEQYSAYKSWLHGQFSKICVTVDSEEELMRIYGEAVQAKLPVKLITDSGRTEFHGVPTRTCLAIGPCWAEDVDRITGKLRLY